MYVFFFKQKTAYEMRIRDWSSDVCSPISTGGVRACDHVSWLPRYADWGAIGGASGRRLWSRRELSGFRRAGARAADAEDRLSGRGRLGSHHARVGDDIRP